MLDPVERKKLIVEHLPLVGHLAREAHGRASHVEREELAAAGREALVKAADDFDPTLGVPFGAFARNRIIWGIAHEMREMDWASRTTRTRIKEVTAAQDSLTSELGRPATPEEIAEATGLTVDEVTQTLADADRQVVNIDDSPAHNLPMTLALPEETAMMRERRELVLHAISALPERMRAIVKGVYFDEKSVKDIAEELGVTHSAVSQQRSEAVKLLRDAIEKFYAPSSDGPHSKVSQATRAQFFDRIEQAIGGKIPA